MKVRALIYIAVAGILWGTSVIFSKILHTYGFTPVQMTAMRGTVSAVVMALYILIHDRKLFCITKKELLFYLLSGLSIFGTATCYYASMEAASAPTAVILMYTAPIYVTIYSAAFMGEKLNGKKVASILLMLLGCVLVSGILEDAKFNFRGIMLGVASGILYSVYNLLGRVEMMKGFKALSVTLYSFIFMGLSALMVSEPLGILENAAKAPLVTWPLIIGIGICTCVLPYFFYTLALRDIPAGTATALGTIEPMAATVFGVWFFQEPLTGLSLAGIVLILLAVIMLSESESGKAHRRSREKAEHEKID